MRVKLNTSLAGPDIVAHHGDEIDLSDKEALRLIARGLATHVIPAIETAERAPVETAARRVRKPRALFGRVTA